MRRCSIKPFATWREPSAFARRRFVREFQSLRVPLIRSWLLSIFAAIAATALLRSWDAPMEYREWFTIAILLSFPWCYLFPMSLVSIILSRWVSIRHFGITMQNGQTFTAVAPEKLLRWRFVNAGGISALAIRLAGVRNRRRTMVLGLDEATDLLEVDRALEKMLRLGAWRRRRRKSRRADTYRSISTPDDGGAAVTTS